jgi:diadenosine tetraphosphate (Ap4A) HIT family hydrolase
MCHGPRVDENEFGIRVYAGPYADAYLQRANIQRGYTLVIWRGRHVNEPTELDSIEAAGYWADVLIVARALIEHFEPLKMNYETLGNTVPHLHTHLVPRYRRDPTPGQPFPLRAQDGTEPKLPAELVAAEADELRARLRLAPKF